LTGTWSRRAVDADRFEHSRPIVTGAIINVRPVGVLKMEDDAGGDEKIIAVPVPRLTLRAQRQRTNDRSTQVPYH